MIKRTHFYSLYQEVLATLPQTIMAYYETLENIKTIIGNRETYPADTLP